MTIVAEGKLGTLILLLITFAFSYYYYWKAVKKGEKLFMRRVPGMDAIDEAIGRATEMGRPVIFSTGYGGAGLDSPKAPAHMAGLSTLSYIARFTARYGVPLITTYCWPEMMPVGEEVVRTSYTMEGKPEEVKPEMFRFFSTDQYTYALGTFGTVEEEKPAACFWLGHYWEECLIVAEPGAYLGAIQVGATIDCASGPFFTAICDYAAFGEEVYCMAAYATKDYEAIGSIAGADACKFICIALVIIGAIAVTAGLDISIFTI